MAKRNYSNVAPPLPLSAAVNSSAVTLQVTSTTGYPEVPFIVAVERGTASEEVCLCTEKTATTFTVTRGYDGTNASPHGIGSMVEHTVAAIDYREGSLDPMTTEERDMLTGDNLFEGLVISNTDTNTVDVYHGGEWIGLVRADDPGMTDAREPTEHTHGDFYTEEEADDRFSRLFVQNEEPAPAASAGPVLWFDPDDQASTFGTGIPDAAGYQYTDGVLTLITETAGETAGRTTALAYHPDGRLNTVTVTFDGFQDVFTYTYVGLLLTGYTYLRSAV